MTTTKKAAGDGLPERVTQLEVRVTALESARPGRKAKPMVAVRQTGVCAIDPERDSATCADASIFRYQIGCHGTACRAKQHAAYMRRKARTPKPKAAAATKKTVAKKVAPKKVAEPKRKGMAVKKSAISSGNGAAKKKAPAKRVSA